MGLRTLSFIGLLNCLLLSALLSAQSPPASTSSTTAESQPRSLEPANKDIGPSVQTGPIKNAVGGVIDVKPLTLFEALYLALTFIAALAAILSIRALVRQSRAASDAAVAAAQISVDSIFINQPHLRRYFLSGEDVPPESQDYPQAAAVAQTLLNFFESYFRQRGRNDQLYDDATWHAYMSDHFKGSPLLRRYLVQNASWYTKDIVAFAQGIEVGPYAPLLATHEEVQGSKKMPGAQVLEQAVVPTSQSQVPVDTKQRHKRKHH